MTKKQLLEALLAFLMLIFVVCCSLFGTYLGGSAFCGHWLDWEHGKFNCNK